MNKLLLYSIACLMLFGSCATESPRGPQGSFSVKVVPFFGSNVRVYIEVHEWVNGKRGPSLSKRRVTGDGVTGFVLPSGKTYGASAFADLDGDGKKGAGDPAASIKGLNPEPDVNAAQEPAILTLPGTGAAPDWPRKKTADPGAGTEGSARAMVQKGLDQVREAAPQLPLPPPPLPPGPPPPR